MPLTRSSSTTPRTSGRLAPLVRAGAVAAALAALSACTDGTGGAAGDADVGGDILDSGSNPFEPADNGDASNPTSPGSEGGIGGGSAGDGGGGSLVFTSSPIEPFVGVWDLTGNWDGRDGDAASLVIRPIGEDGTARVLLYDLDDLNGGDNCYFRPPSGGVAEPDVTGQRVFMNRVLPFEDAELSLDGQTLLIDYFGANDARLRYTATRVGITETDLVPRC